MAKFIKFLWVNARTGVKLSTRVVFIMQAMLDKLALEMEKNKLMEENVKLSTALRNHLDGLTIAERLKTAYNVLMVRYSPTPKYLNLWFFLFGDKWNNLFFIAHFCFTRPLRPKKGGGALLAASNGTTKLGEEWSTWACWLSTFCV